MTRSSLDTERKKAHAKMRDEIRIAVKEEILRNGLSRVDIRKAIEDEIKIGADKAMKGTSMKTVLTAYIREEFVKLLGANYTAQAAKAAVLAEINVIASKFVNDALVIKAIDQKDTW